MPQMMPLNWLTLMLMFIAMFIILISINYYSFIYNNKTTLMNKKSIQINWKW
uniref:ATP synthase complex subunit 8 n=1 Tax=Tenebrionoidea sp. 15 KM-2017 TaxID=2219470 RepID=A0A346RIK6_9CUCU|nr:ATP synthase F0 subunit 8 [Tenebrionoidea sp. 15 KM-2017]